MLGILLHPYKNELLASWFVRLAAQNGIDSTTRFLKAYVCPQKAEKAIQNTLSCTNLYLTISCQPNSNFSALYSGIGKAIDFALNTDIYQKQIDRIKTLAGKMNKVIELIE